MLNGWLDWVLGRDSKQRERTRRQAQYASDEFNNAKEGLDDAIVALVKALRGTDKDDRHEPRSNSR